MKIMKDKDQDMNSKVQPVNWHMTPLKSGDRFEQRTMIKAGNEAIVTS